MLRRINFTYIIILGLVFVTVGDRFLPQPLSAASLQTRTTADNYLEQLFPSWHPKTKPYERTEKAINDVEQKESGAR